MKVVCKSLSLFNDFIKDKICSEFLESRFAVGSSARITGAFVKDEHKVGSDVYKVGK